MDFNVQKINTFTGHKGSIYTLCEAEKDHFFSAGEDGIVAKWSIFDPEHGKPIAQMQRSIYALFYIVERDLLVVAQNQSGIHIIDLNSAKEIKTISIPQVSFFDIKLHGNTLIVSDSQGNIHIIDADIFILLQTISISQKSLRRMDICCDQLAVSSSDHKIYILRLPSFEKIRTIEAHKNSVFALAFTSNALMSGSRDAHIKAWDLENNFSNVQDVPAHTYAINDLQYLKDQNLILSCSMDRSIKIWQASDLKLLKVINKSRNAGHGNSINKLLWMPKSQFLFSASDDRSISMWNLF